MEELQSRFLSAKDIANMCNVSKSQAYKVIKLLNEELKQQGKIVFAGKVSRKYFESKID